LLNCRDLVVNIKTVMNKIYIAAITEVGCCDIFTSTSERGLLNKLEQYLSNEAKFNTLQEFQDHLYNNDVYEGCEVFFKVEELN